MNEAGFNHDWNDTMHSIRIEIRNYLDSILTTEYKQKIKKFYEEMGGGDYYGARLLGFGFEVIQNNSNYDNKYFL